MSGIDTFNLVWLPLMLGLFGFIEPCSIGSSLLFIKYLEGKSATHKFAQVGIFALTRALFTGALGLLSVLDRHGVSRISESCLDRFWNDLCVIRCHVRYR